MQSCFINALSVCLSLLFCRSFCRFRLLPSMPKKRFRTLYLVCSAFTSILGTLCWFWFRFEEVLKPVKEVVNV